VDLQKKVTDALTLALRPDYVRLEDDGGVSGIVVSPIFASKSAVERQGMIDSALRSSARLTQEDLRNILAIAALTPAEFEAAGPKIRVHQVREMADGAVEVTPHGRLSDAEYVRQALKHEEGVRTTEPKHPPGAVGVLVKFRAKGAKNRPLTRARVIGALKRDPLIEVVQRA